MSPPIIVLIASTTLMCSHVSGLGEKQRAAYERVADCISIGTSVNLPDEHPPVKTSTCDTYKAMYPCVTQTLGSDSNTEMWDFFEAFHLQRIFFINKANMCREPLRFLELKELVKKSGIMDREKLPSVENDEYVPCAGEINMRCMKAAYHPWEGHANDLRILIAFVKCYAEETPKCDFPIARHMNAFVQAFGKHMEEEQGLLSGLLKEIKQ